MARMTTAADRPYRRIATEEAWCTPALMKQFLRVLEDRSVDDPGFYSLWGFFGSSTSDWFISIVSAPMCASDGGVVASNVCVCLTSTFSG